MKLHQGAELVRVNSERVLLRGTLAISRDWRILEAGTGNLGKPQC